MARKRGRPHICIAVRLSVLWLRQLLMFGRAHRPVRAKPARGDGALTLLRESSSGAEPRCGFLVWFLCWLQHESVPEESQMLSPVAPAGGSRPCLGLLCLPVAATSWSPFKEQDERAGAQTGCSSVGGAGTGAGRDAAAARGRAAGTGDRCEFRSH